MKDQIRDVASAINEDGISAFLESDTFQMVVQNMASQLLEGSAAELTSSLLGALAPRINGVVLNYKQKRFERNVNAMLEKFAQRIDVLEHNYLSLTLEMQEKYRGLYVEMLLDNVIDEPQQEKIDWNVNGFINMMTNESNENIMRIFFETLSELTVLDVDTLKMYSIDENVKYQDIEQKYGIDYERIKMVKEKLVRLGLLNRKNDLLRDKNLDEIVEYLIKVEAESKKTRPKDIKLPKSIKKIGRSESYTITMLGYSFLKSIDEIA